jgi:cytochrome b
MKKTKLLMILAITAALLFLTACGLLEQREEYFDVNTDAITPEQHLFLL